MKQSPIHGSCVMIGAAGVLLLGPSGAGKSDLALRLIDQGARLVADDYVILSTKDGNLYASPPQRLRGLLEVRGLGLLRLSDYAESALVALVVSLVKENEVERLPAKQYYEHEDIKIPSFSLYGLEASAPAKLRLAMSVACGKISLLTGEEN